MQPGASQPCAAFPCQRPGASQPISSHEDTEQTAVEDDHEMRAARCDPSTYASFVTSAFQSYVHIGLLVQALRFNSSSALLGVRPGSEWKFGVDRLLCFEPDECGPPDVMSQTVLYEIIIEEGNSKVAFEHFWDDGGNAVSIALLEAMRTNKIVRSLDMYVENLEELHLTAIVDSLLENDTLQSFSVCADYCAIHSPFEAISEAFLRILKRNMCLRDVDITCLMPVPLGDDAEDELFYSGADWQEDLGATVMEALERNRQAFVVATRLGQVSRSSMHGSPHLGYVGFRRQLLHYFLEEGCQPPRQMLHIATGLPKP